MPCTFALLHDLSTTVILHKTPVTFSPACWPSTSVSSAAHLQPSTAGAVPHAPLTLVRLWKRSRPKFTHWSPREAETGYSRHKVRTGEISSDPVHLRAGARQETRHQASANRATGPIACSQGKDGSFCAFFQNTSGTGKQAEALVQKLLDRGCKRCGSVATHPGNDVSAGALTVNLVKEPCCKGDCFCSGRGARIRKVE